MSGLVVLVVRTVVPVELLEPARRPVGLGRIAAARAVEARNVLERDEDVPVQLDVGHVLDRAVGSQHPFLVLAAEERELDLLAFVLVGVVLHRPQSSRSRLSKRLPTPYTSQNVVLVWPGCDLGTVTCSGHI